MTGSFYEGRQGYGAPQQEVDSYQHSYLAHEQAEYDYYMA